MKQFRITSAKDAKNTLEYFNAFHDGLLKRIEIVSKDEVTPEKSQICTGLFDVTLTIAHYNYDQGRQPYNRMIKLAFSSAQRIHMDFRSVGNCDWNINALEVREAGDFLICVLQRNRYDGKTWIIQEHDLFQFENAEISEQ
jgi:hypothetical protein